jgi:hypothetical protein
MITYANNGTDSSGFADMGMTGNTFNDLNYTITAPNDGYLFVQGTTSGGGNLIIATGDAGNTHDIVFATGGFLAANEKLRLIDAANTLQPYANLSLDLGSNTNYFGNVYANSVTLAEDFSANNISAVNNIAGVNLTVTGTADIGDTNIVGEVAITGNTTTSGNNVTTGTITAGGLTTSGNVSADAVTTVDLTALGLTNLGDIGNITITGGANGQAIITDGTGNLTWGNAGSAPVSPISAIPAVYFTSAADANNLSFSNVILNGYANAENMTVFYNGALLENTFYTLSGDTITVNTPLVIGDTIDIPTQYGGNITAVTSGYGNSNVALFLTTYAGNIVPAVDNNYTLGNTTRRWNTVYSANVAVTTVSASGNVTGNFFIGNGSQLTGLPASYSDANVSSYLASGTDTAGYTTSGVLTLAQTLVSPTAVTMRLVADGPDGYIQVGNGVGGSGGNVSFARYFDGTGQVVINTVSGNVSATGSVNAAGQVSATGNVTGGNILTAGYVKVQATTFAGLPSASSAGVGARAFITDATSTTFNAAAAGGGANNMPVFSNGTSWFIG